MCINKPTCTGNVIWKQEVHGYKSSINVEMTLKSPMSTSIFSSSLSLTFLGWAVVSYDALPSEVVLTHTLERFFGEARLALT